LPDALRLGDQRPPALIKPDLQDRLWPYLGGIARENKIKALEIGGVDNHIHVLLSIPPALSIAKAIQLLKGNSSKWIHETFKEHWSFEWQEGYGAFSIGISGVEGTASTSGIRQGTIERLSFRKRSRLS
jgi:REP element-mobilizing transposase RayT